MKKGKKEIHLHFSNRWLYTFIILGILAIVSVSVYAAQQTSSGGGTHNFAEVGLPSCSNTQVLKWSGGTWACGTDGGDGVGYVSGDSPTFGTVTAASYLYSSDKSLKTNIQQLQNSLDNIKSLEGVSFNWKSNNEESIGLIAQDVEKIFPEVVTTNSEGLKAVDYAKLVAVLIEAVKEQQKQIDELKAQLE